MEYADEKKERTLGWLVETRRSWLLRCPDLQGTSSTSLADRHSFGVVGIAAALSVASSKQQATMSARNNC